MPILPDDVLAEVAKLAVDVLEVREPVELEIVRRHVTPFALQAAWFMAETDPEWALRWAAASDYSERAGIVHEVLLYLLTPERRA